MLRDTWLFIAAAAVVAGIIFASPGIIALGLLLGAACYGATWWAKRSLDRLAYDRVIPEDHGFAGDKLEVRLRVANNKRLPLPWLEVTERFPAEMLAGDPGEFVTTGEGQFAQTEWRTALRGHQRVSRSYDLRCEHRGLYDIGPGWIRSGDPLGLFRSERPESRRSHIVVYPRIVDLGELHLPAMRPYGEQRGGSTLFEDPSRIAGVRDYEPGDPLRRVDWNATARLGRMQSRVYEPASSRHVLVCLNTQTIVPMWQGVIQEVLERSVVVAASVARDAYDARYSVGLLANSNYPESDRAVRIPPGRRAEQFIRILEALAVVTPFVREPLSAMLDREEHRLAHGTTIAIVTGLLTEDLAASVERLSRRGHKIVLLRTGDSWDTVVPGVEERDLSDVEAPWRPPVEGVAPL